MIVRVSRIKGFWPGARDGEIGYVVDFLIEAADLSIHYLVYQTLNLWPGRRVLISPRSIPSTDWPSRLAELDRTKAGQQVSPVFDGSQTVDCADQYALRCDYGSKRVVEPV